ncbi:glutamine amidotransferase [Bacillus canaveralius]|uniref:Lipid II isoglutaminyl synthase (glutamine-hydrolyzing) subunit GatD n=1 Tax=Bacillus canaveralius TaxID=1403243 RepID=A0A2N5GMC2_9BACI|nr:glutamine amidotransferase [Bacillus canaveralius]PLR83008.1 glutamine amidotransferase [Bacillus canaveralius]PLR96988.1 glutamine amidotransferase [Bacillus canaveralius]RSK47917.1 glutamine amidotransferase [Bacillus canaveralius]
MERKVPLQSSKQLTLYYFFPDKLNLYGDRGNIISLAKRSEWRGINLNIKEIRSTDGVTLEDMDLFFIGGGSDREQSVATAELQNIKIQLKEKIESGVPGLTICGGYQFLGNQYIDANGNELECLGILDFYTVAKQPRLTGNILVQSELFGEIVGFENHAGRTYHSYRPLGKVEKGSGNNDDSGLEGLLYKNLIGTYLHGPILPKNPAISDYLIAKAIEHRYDEDTASAWITQLDDYLEHLTRKQVCKRVKNG